MKDKPQALAVVPSDTTTRPSHRPQSLVNSYRDARSFAQAYAVSGLKTSKGGAVEIRAAEALVKIEAGAELGIGPMAAITAFHVIEGKPALSATGWAALVDGSDVYDYEVSAHTDEVCEIVFFKGGRQRGISTFTMEDARRAGLVRQGGNWEKYPKAMLFARAFTAGARAYCPAVGMGMAIYTPEELEVVAGNAHHAEQEGVPSEPEEVDADFEEKPVDEPAPERHAEGAKAAAEREAQRNVAKVVAHELEKLQTQPEVSAWADANTERIEALPERQAEALWSYVDAMQALRAGEPYRPMNPGDLRAVKAIRRLAALPEVDFAQVPDGPPHIDDSDADEPGSDDELPDDQRYGGGDS